MGFLTKGLPHELQTFPIDVFLSYSHGAFAGQSSSRLKAWSRKLADDLREELLGLGLDDLSLFIDSSDREDEGVDRTERLAEQLKDRVKGAAILSVLMSSPYLRSRWCGQERDWWTGRNSPDPLAVGGRVFLCRAQPTDEAAWPDALKGLFGYCFYDKDKRPDLARPNTYGGATADLDEYLDALVRLCGDIAQRLKAVRGSSTTATGNGSSSSGPPPRAARSSISTAGRNAPRRGPMPASGSRASASWSTRTGPSLWPRAVVWTPSRAARSRSATDC